jgi:glycerol-3-phosphate dehydrogenase (NAD(P)+)
MSESQVQPFTTAVIGAGSWGTALAIALARNGHPVTLWARDEQQLAAMKSSRTNERYLPGIVFPDSLTLADSFEQAVSTAHHVLVSVPSTAFKDTIEKIKPLLCDAAQISWATKGLTPDTGRFLFDTAYDVLGENHPLAVITGPSFATEVAKGLPTAITVASEDESFRQALASALHGPSMRAYTTNDILGAQIGGTVKNVLAISAGISDGLGYGANARAALITRGMAEILRLAASLGAKQETMIGLSGIGDLILTCTDDQSRNRQLGLAIGRGLSVDEAVKAVGKTVEGMYAAKEVLKRAKQAGVEMPIVEQVYKILFEGYEPNASVQELLCREQKAE